MSFLKGFLSVEVNDWQPLCSHSMAESGHFTQIGIMGFHVSWHPETSILKEGPPKHVGQIIAGNRKSVDI